MMTEAIAPVSNGDYLSLPKPPDVAKGDVMEVTLLGLTEGEVHIEQENGTITEKTGTSIVHFKSAELDGYRIQCELTDETNRDIWSYESPMNGITKVRVLVTDKTGDLVSVTVIPHREYNQKPA